MGATTTDEKVQAQANVIDELFTYHAPDADQLNNYAAIRTAAKTLAKIIITNTPKCPDQSAAIRKLREAVMTANAAVALKGLSL